MGDPSPSSVSYAIRAAPPEPSTPERRPARLDRAASARAVPGSPSRPPPEPPPEQQPALSMHSGGSCASCRRPSRRHPRQPPPWSFPRPPLCLRQGPVCPPFLFAALRRPRAVSALQRREHAKKWEVNSEHVLQTVKIEVINSQPGLKVDTFEKVVCTERSQAGGSNGATLTNKCTQEGFFPSRKRSCATR